MKKVYIENGSHEYRHLFESLGYVLVSDFDEADIVCFTGGADVSPWLYGDEAHRQTGNSPLRDGRESMVFAAAKRAGKAMVGICRGGQFLNVMNGGRMYQHVEGHCRPHSMTDVESGEVIYVSSTHHQMMMPAADAHIIATANEQQSREWFDGQVARRDISPENGDIEVVWYEASKCLCFQPHPEFDRPEYEGMKEYFGELLTLYFRA
jgi:GMP synthase-like glutamine amidotransferase